MGNVRSLVIKSLDETTTPANGEWKLTNVAPFYLRITFRIFEMIPFIPSPDNLIVNLNERKITRRCYSRFHLRMVRIY